MSKKNELGKIPHYCMEMRLLFQYYRDKEVEEIARKQGAKSFREAFEFGLTLL